MPHIQLDIILLINAVFTLLQTTAEFEREISQTADGQASGFNTAAYHAYDAVWMLARGIDRYM